MGAASKQQTGEQGITAVDVEVGITPSLSGRLKGLASEALALEPFTIVRLPGSIRQWDRNLHEPSVLPIGPYHRDKGDLRTMRVHKLRCLRNLLSRWPETSLEQWLEKCICEIKALETRARRCYAEDFDLSSEEFVEMLLLDGCFILELMAKLAEGVWDTMLFPGWNWHLIVSDLIMLDNQIPFFVLDGLYNLLLGSEPDSSKVHLRKLAATTLTCGEMIDFPDFTSIGDVHHLLHLRYKCFCPFPNPWEEEQPPTCCNSVVDCLIISVRSLFGWRRHAIVTTMDLICSLYLRIISLLDTRVPWARRVHMEVKKGFFWLFPCQRYTKPVFPASNTLRWTSTIPCATELQEAGVRFRRKAIDEKKASSFLDISFDSKGYMVIPRLVVYDSTKTLLMNLVAFEQSHGGLYQVFISYAYLMDGLINTEKDVEVLRSCGVLENNLSSDEELAEFFNQLPKSFWMQQEYYYYLKLENKVLQYYESKWPRWRAKLMRDYLSNPWAILSLVGAVVLLILTIAQTILAFFAYFRPPS